MKSATFLLIAISIYLTAMAGPEEYYEKQKAKYLSGIEKADRKLEQAKKDREKDVLDLTKDYIKDLEKIKVHWTKKGNFEEAMQFKKQIDELQKLVDSGKPLRIETPLKESPKQSALPSGVKNIALEATATAKDFRHGNSPSMAIDGNPGSYWYGENNLSPDCWLELNFKRSHKVSYFKLTLPSGIKPFSNGHEPLSYKIWAKDLRGEYREIVSVVDGKYPAPLLSEERPASRTVTIPLETTFYTKAIKFVCSKTSGKNYAPLIYELEVYGR